MKYGLEQEFFVFRDSQLIGPVPSELTPDECGFLAEARGQPCHTIREAIFSLMADVYRLETEATKLGLTLVKEPILDVPRAIILECRRKFTKPTLDYQNLYGYQEHKNKGKKTAGIHISFTDERVILNDQKSPTTVNLIFDFVQIFRKLDLGFKAEIRAAKRYPGFYELKADKRIEYRSLPNNCDLLKIIQVLS